MGLKSNFADAAGWDELSKNIPYRMPKWSEPLTIEKMELWLDRLNISKALYNNLWNTSLQEFINLNPDWPLRAFVGLLLEEKFA